MRVSRRGTPPEAAPGRGLLFFCARPRANKPLVIDADVAQLVAHHLAKVRVAGSNPVIRSEGSRSQDVLTRLDTFAVEWPSGEAAACKAVNTGSIPVSTSTSA